LNGPTPEWTSKFGDEFGVAYPEGAFIVRGGNLGFSVIVFIIAAVVAILVLHVRRVKLGGELGGPRLPQVLSAVTLVLLWFFYCGLSVWKISSAPASDSIGAQIGAILIGICVFENILLVSAGVMMYLGSKGPEPDIENQEPGERDSLTPKSMALHPSANTFGAAHSHGLRHIAASQWSQSGMPSQPGAYQHSFGDADLGAGVGTFGSQPSFGGSPSVVGRPLENYATTDEFPPLETCRSTKTDGGFGRAALVCLAAARLRRGKARTQLWPDNPHRRRLDRGQSFYSVADADDVLVEAGARVRAGSASPPPTQTFGNMPGRRSSIARGVGLVAHLTSPWAEEPPSPRMVPPSPSANQDSWEAKGLLRPGS